MERTRVLNAACGLGALAVLVPYLALAVFARPGSDDFCHTLTVPEYGWWGNQLFWYLDDELIGSTASGQELLREVGPGRHVIRAMDADGDRDTVIFTIADSL